MAKRLSKIFEPPDLEAAGEIVSSAEIDFFKENGFLFKRNLISAKDATAALERVWDVLIRDVPPAEDSGWQISRDAEDSWRNPRWSPMPSADETGFFEGRQRNAIHGRTVKMHEVGSERFLLELLPNNPRVRSVAQVMLGEKLRETERTRGVYAFFPPRRLSDEERNLRISGEALGPHTDRVCQQLNVCTYLDDVPERTGGFTLYPGSHRILFNAHTYESNWSPTEQYATAVKKVVDTITPVELVAEPGDVIFWHGRMVHTAGIHVGTKIRWAVFADFMQDLPVLDADEHREAGQYEWFKDTKLLRQDHEVSEDLWRYWRFN